MITDWQMKKPCKRYWNVCRTLYLITLS